MTSDIKLWEEIANHLGSNPQDIKQRLNLIIDRRNKIAHEADINPTFPGDRWPIDEALVDEAINFIKQIAETIYQVL